MVFQLHAGSLPRCTCAACPVISWWLNRYLHRRQPQVSPRERHALSGMSFFLSAISRSLLSLLSFARSFLLSFHIPMPMTLPRDALARKTPGTPVARGNCARYQAGELCLFPEICGRRAGVNAISYQLIRVRRHGGMLASGNMGTDRYCV